MTLSDVIALAHAGFSKEQIMTFAQPVAQPIAQPVARPIAQPVAQPIAQAQQTGLSDNQFAQLLQTINSANATIDIPPTVSVDEKLAEHFTTMLVGEKKEVSK